MTDRPRTRLYLITPPVIGDVAAFARQLESAMDAGDVACLQIRCKPAGVFDADMTTRVAEVVLKPAQARGVAVLINDSVEVAERVGADGVHLGASDMSVRAARERLGASLIIGATAKNSRHTAMVAGEAGADYVAFGAFYPTQTKADTVAADPELLTLWQEQMELPCVAIGGITVDNALPLVRAGADFIAVSSGVWAHPDGPAAAVARFNTLFDAHSQSN